MNWEAVYAEQLPRVYNYYRYRMGNEAVAEDLTSRTFEKAWRERHRYRRDFAGVATWLLRIARNTAIDHLRTSHVHEIGLRVLGIERAEAHRFAQNVDWQALIAEPDCRLLHLYPYPAGRWCGGLSRTSSLLWLWRRGGCADAPSDAAAAQPMERGVAPA